MGVFQFSIKFDDNFFQRKKSLAPSWKVKWSLWIMSYHTWFPHIIYGTLHQISTKLDPCVCVWGGGQNQTNASLWSIYINKTSSFFSTHFLLKYASLFVTTNSFDICKSFFTNLQQVSPLAWSIVINNIYIYIFCKK